MKMLEIVFVNDKIYRDINEKQKNIQLSTNFKIRVNVYASEYLF